MDARGFVHARYGLRPGRYLLFWELFGVNLCSLFGLKLGHAGAGGAVGSDSGYSKAPNFIAQCLSGFENPLPRTKVQGYTRISVFPQPVLRQMAG
jgi:hypothetical protein